MTRREEAALDQAKRVLLEAEHAAGHGQADRLIQIADRWLAIAEAEKSKR